MRQLPSDKYNVAWFKLAEFVVRGEKERALGLYRLLVHSFDDRALAYQLEGDLLVSFNDVGAACERYRSAAQEYKMVGKSIEAAAVYEHLHTLFPDQEEYLVVLLALYQELLIYSRFWSALKRLCELLLHKKETARVITFMTSFQEILSLHQQAQLYGMLTLAFTKNNDSEEHIMEYLTKALDLLILDDDTSHLSSFLASLDAQSPTYYQKAVRYIKE